MALLYLPEDWFVGVISVDGEAKLKASIRIVLNSNSCDSDVSGWLKG